MNRFLAKRGATIAVTLIGFVVVLPYFMWEENEAGTNDAETTKEADKEKDKTAGKGSKVALKTLLRPKPAPKPSRNPFRDPLVAQTEAKAMIAKRLKEFLAAKVLKGVDPDELFSKKSEKKKGKPGKPDVEFDPCQSLALNATYISGNRGAAMINGSLYRAGDTIRDVETPEPCKVESVNNNQVIIRYQGKAYPLVYKTAGDNQSAPQSGFKVSIKGGKPGKVGKGKRLAKDPFDD